MGKMDHDRTRLSRRRFVTASLTAAGGLAIGVASSKGAWAGLSVAAEPWTDPVDSKGSEINAWLAIEPDDTVAHPCRQVGNGGGDPHLAADDRGRGAPVRLAKGQGGVRLGQPQPARGQRLWPHGDRRQQLGPPLARVSSAGRRQRSRPPDRGGGAPLGRSGVRLPGRVGQRPPCRDRPKPHLRGAGRRCRRNRPAGRAGHQDARPVHADRQADGAARHAPQGHRSGDLRHRHPPAGNALRRRPDLPGLRRQRRELRPEGGRRSARCGGRRAGAGRARGRRGPLLAGQAGGLWRCRSPGRKGLPPRPTAPSSTRPIARRSTGRRSPRTRRATSRPGLRAASASRRSTRFPISPTRRWSR